MDNILYSYDIIIHYMGNTTSQRRTLPIIENIEEIYNINNNNNNIPEGLHYNDIHSYVHESSLSPSSNLGLHNSNNLLPTQYMPRISNTSIYDRHIPNIGIIENLENITDVQSLPDIEDMVANIRSSSRPEYYIPDVGVLNSAY